MHDLIAAQTILKTVLAQAEKKGWKRIDKVLVELGEIEDHGELLNSANLGFNFRLIAKGTPAEKAKLVIKKIKEPVYKIREIEGS